MSSYPNCYFTTHLRTLRKASTISRIVVVSSDKCAKEIATRMGVLFLQQQTDEGVNSAIALADDYCLLTGTEASIVLPQDLPLLLPQDVVEICQLAKTSEKCMIICPSLRYDGSNACCASLLFFSVQSMIPITTICIGRKHLEWVPMSE